MAGTLTIHSSGDGTLLSGHSWIEYQPDGGAPTTYGTWGNNPEGLGNGLHENLELGKTSDASRSAHLDDEQEQKLYAVVQQYKGKGEDGWGYLSPCSTFAEDAWEAATGEKLATRSYGIISNPSKLKDSIEATNANSPAPPDPANRPTSSLRQVSQPTEPCHSSASSGGSS